MRGPYVIATYRFREISDHVVPFLFFLYASKGHFCSRNVLNRMFSYLNPKIEEEKPIGLPFWGSQGNRIAYQVSK